MGQTNPRAVSNPARRQSHRSNIIQPGNVPKVDVLSEDRIVIYEADGENKEKKIDRNFDQKLPKMFQTLSFSEFLNPNMSKCCVFLRNSSIKLQENREQIENIESPLQSSHLWLLWFGLNTRLCIIERFW